MSLQKTIENPTGLSGLGLFSGQQCNVRFLPAKAGSGIVFARKDSAGETVHIACSAANVVKKDRRTALGKGKTVVDTVEHVLSAVAGLGIDNITIEVDAEELPSIDSSPQPFVEALAAGGICEQQAERQVLKITQPVTVSHGDASITALPGSPDVLEIIYDLDYPTSAGMDRQLFAFCLGKDDYAAEIAPARTFLLKAEGEKLQAAGIGAHLTAKDVVVVDDNGVIDNELRFPNEQARHKVADLIGDLTLAGMPLAGRIVASKSGHALNQALAAKLLETTKKSAAKGSTPAPAMDIRRIMRLLPHRYPFLMLDRVLELDGNRKAVAIKNVSVNEPFFQGHYPDQPIMPGVMILEAMAQLSGLLLGRHLETTGKMAVLLSMDRVKMRRPVRPGDQLMLFSESVKVRNRTGHCRCRAMVDDEIAAEADIKFMLIDAEPV